MVPLSSLLQKSSLGLILMEAGEHVSLGAGALRSLGPALGQEMGAGLARAVSVPIVSLLYFSHPFLLIIFFGRKMHNKIHPLLASLYLILSVCHL